MPDRVAQIGLGPTGGSLVGRISAHRVIAHEILIYSKFTINVASAICFGDDALIRGHASRNSFEPERRNAHADGGDTEHDDEDQHDFCAKTQNM